jgi:hypothetical protein
MLEKVNAGALPGLAQKPAFLICFTCKGLFYRTAESAAVDSEKDLKFFTFRYMRKPVRTMRRLYDYL